MSFIPDNLMALILAENQLSMKYISRHPETSARAKGIVDESIAHPKRRRGQCHTLHVCKLGKQRERTGPSDGEAPNNFDIQLTRRNDVTSQSAKRIVPRRVGATSAAKIPYQ